MNKPKALVVASVASMIQQFNMPNIKLLLDMGYDVDVACNFVDSGTIPSSKSRELMNDLEKLNVKYYQVDFDRNAFNLIKNMRAYKQMKKIMLNRYTLVHSHSPIGGVIARLTANKYRKKGLKSIYTAHGFHFYKGSPIKMWLIFYPVEKILSYWTDVLITINKEDYNLASKNMKSKKIEYIPGVGIDIEKFRSVTNQEKRILREKNGMDSSDKILIYVGELSKRKNQIMVLKVMKDLIKYDSNIKLLLVGNGPLYSDYESYIRNHNLHRNVELLGYRSDISELMAMSDIAVSTSLQEGLPVNIMEAMATSLPVVATNCRGNRDLIDDSMKDYLIQNNDIESFSRAIYKLIEDMKKYTEASRMNEKLSKKYSIKNIIMLYKKVYEE